MYSIKFDKKAADFVRKLDNQLQKRLVKKIDELSENPFLGKPLSGNLSGLWRLRCDKYRIIYQVKHQELLIFVLNIGHRKNIYESH